MLTLPSLDLHFRLPSSSSVDQHHCTRMMTFTPLGRSLCPATTSHLKRPLCPRGNFAPYSESYASWQRRTSSDFMPSRQLRTLQRILCLTTMSYLKRPLCPHGNIAPQVTFMPSRQPRTSSAHLYAFEATSHLTANIMPHGNIVPQAIFMPSRQLRTSSDLYALEATWHFKRPFCL